MYNVQVIIALSESRRQHIPYRNSMMTSVLRDSLGGNCMTTMIANCSVDRANIDVSLQSRHFLVLFTLKQEQTLQLIVFMSHSPAPAGFGAGVYLASPEW